MGHFAKIAVEVIGVAVAIAAAIPTGGASAAVGTTLLSSTLGVSAATASAIAAGTGLAAAAVGALTAKAPAQLATPTEWQSDPQAGVPHVGGRMFVAGQIVYRATFDKDNVNQTINTVYSTGPIQGFEGWYFSGVQSPIDGNGHPTNVVDGEKIYIGWQLGRQPEPVQLAGTNNPGITAMSKLSGLAASTITLSYDTTGGHTFTTEPQIGAVVLGTPVYDARQDSTYPGGAANGPQRSNDETTWSFAHYDNPGLKALAWLIGYRQNGYVVAGVGLPISSINVAQFVEMANVCDANGWKCGFEAKSTDNPWQVFTQILQAGGAVPTRGGAITGCMVNAPKVSLATFEIDDIIGDWSIQATQSRRDRINAIVPRYMAEQSITGETTDSKGNVVLQTTVTWGMQPAGVIAVASYAAEDGGQRLKGVDYPYVTGIETGGNAPNQVAQLARYDIENAREFGPISLPMKPRWMGYRAGDVITGGASVTELGLVGQDIMIMQRQFSPANMTVTITARSETAAKHAFALGQTTTAPPTPMLSGPPLIPVPGPAAWAISATQVSEGGSVYPGLIISGATDSFVIDAIIFEYRIYTGEQADGDDWIAAGSEQPSTTTKPILILHDGAVCQAAVSYRKGPGTGTRLILGPETIGTTTIDFANIDGTTKQALLSQVQNATTSAANSSGQLAIIASTGYLSRDKKPTVIQDWAAIVAEAAPLDAQADALGVSRTTFDNARAALQAYLTSLTPAWNDATQDTAIVGATFEGKFNDYYFAKVSLTTALDAAASKVATWDGVYGSGKDNLVAQSAAAASNASSALSVLNVIASTGYLSRDKKPTVIQDVTAITNEKPQLDTQAASLGVSVATYDSAYQALQSYLSTLSPAWNDATQDTAIVGTTFEGKFSDYYYARMLLDNAMTGAAAQSITAVNRIRFSRFEGGTKGWANRYDPNAVGQPISAQSGTVGPALILTARPTAAGQYVSFGTAEPAYRIPVTAGERLCFVIGLQATGVTSRGATLFYQKADGTALLDANNNAVGLSMEAAGVGGIDQKLFAFGIVPPGAVTAVVEVNGYSAQAYSASNPGPTQVFLALTQPMVCAVGSAQTTYPPFVAGPNSDDGADVTSTAWQILTGQTPAQTQAAVGAVTATANDAHTIATEANAFASDAADNDHMSGDEKKRWRGDISAWAGTGSGSVAAIVAQLNKYGLTTIAASVNSTWTAFYNLLVAMDYTGSESTTFSSAGSSRSSFVATEQAFANALEAGDAALTTYANQLSLQTTASLFTDPTFSRPTSTAEWSQFTLANASQVENDPHGRRVHFLGGANASTLTTTFFAGNAGDRIDVTTNAYVQSDAAGGGVAFYVNYFDANGNPLSSHYNDVPIYVPAGYATLNSWVLKIAGTVVFPTGATGATIAIVANHTAGSIFIETPFAQKTAKNVSNLDATGRQNNALLNRLYTFNASAQVSGLTATVTSSAMTLSNFSVDFGAGFVNITGSTTSGLAAATTYYMWILSPNLDNGSHSIVVSTNFTGSVSADRLYLGSFTTQTSSGTGGNVGGSGGSTGGGGTGGNFCVVEDNWLTGSVSARDGRPGDTVDLVRLDGLGTETGTIRHAERAVAWCVRLTTASGGVVEVSRDTDVERPDGSTYRAAHALDEPIGAEIDGDWRWERCVAVKDIGQRWVIRFDMGNRSYLAGVDPRFRVATHNIKSQP